jgi:hypothetical protein
VALPASALGPAGLFLGGGVAIIGAALPLIYVVLSVMMLFLFLKLSAFFLSAYIQIIIAIILGPLQILFEALPGSTAFSSWFKNLIANLAVFPIAGAMFMLAGVFVKFSNLTTGTMWVPPYTPVILNSNHINAIAALVSLGIIFAIPNVAGSVKEALKAKSPMPMFDTGGAGGSVMQTLSMAYYAKMLYPGQLLERITGKKPGGKE